MPDPAPRPTVDEFLARRRAEEAPRDEFADLMDRVLKVFHGFEPDMMGSRGLSSQPMWLVRDERSFEAFALAANAAPALAAHARRLAARIGELEGERDEWEAFAEDVRIELQKFTGPPVTPDNPLVPESRKFGTAHCVHCGWTGLKKSFAEADAEVQEHTRTCDKHPLAQARADVARLTAELAEARAELNEYPVKLHAWTVWGDDLAERLDPCKSEDAPEAVWSTEDVRRIIGEAAEAGRQRDVPEDVGPYVYIGMPLNADGRGPETRPERVAKTVWQVWESELGPTIAECPTKDAAEIVVAGLNRLIRLTTSGGESPGTKGG